MSILNSANVKELHADMLDIIYSWSKEHVETILPGLEETLFTDVTSAGLEVPVRDLMFSLTPEIRFRRAGTVVEYGYDDDSLPFKIEFDINDSCLEVNFDLAIKSGDKVFSTGCLTVVYDVSDVDARHVTYVPSLSHSTLDFLPEFDNCTLIELGKQDLTCDDLLRLDDQRFEKLDNYLNLWLTKLVDEVNNCVYDNCSTGHDVLSLRPIVA